MSEQHTIFISHSSKDEPIITPFIDKILNVGLEISRDKIFYTSAKDTGIKSEMILRKQSKVKSLTQLQLFRLLPKIIKKVKFV